MARKLFLIGACAFLFAAAAGYASRSSPTHVAKIPCVTSAQCPANKPVCVFGQCEDPEDD